jgi:exopolyphosphatase/guanosine-5'-triphosphate,3'-diphosphate pyrophosphatase
MLLVHRFMYNERGRTREVIVRYAIVDIGSNTMRFIVYEVDADGIHRLFSKKTVAGLSSYITNGKISQKGMQKAAKVLGSYKSIADLLQTEHFLPFATASLRNIENREEALHYIREKSGADIQVVDGSLEALYGYRALTISQDVPSGILFDIGGGSTEIIYFLDREVRRAESIPMGSLNTFTTMTKDLVPSSKETKKIKNEFYAQLDAAHIPKNTKQEELFGIGGTVRACGNVCQEYFGLDSNKEIPAEAIRQLIRDLRLENRTALRTLLQVVPERIHTLTPGMLLIEALLSRFSAKRMTVNKYGVREGFIVERLRKEGVLHDGFVVD